MPVFGRGSVWGVVGVSAQVCMCVKRGGGGADRQTDRQTDGQTDRRTDREECRN